MGKPWKPKIVEVNPSRGYLHLHYGISEERRIILADKLNSLSQVSGSTVISMAGRIDQVAEIAGTYEEFIFCLVCDMIYLQNSEKHTLIFNS